MKKETTRENNSPAIVGLLIAALGILDPFLSYAQETNSQSVDLLVQQQTGDQSANLLVQLGASATLCVDAAPGNIYQWLDNGKPINGQTNSILSFENTQIGDAGNYSCSIANRAAVVSTTTASLEVETLTPDFLVVVYAQPITSGGSSGSCPGHYTGYVNYTLPATNGWGWDPSTNTTIYTASDNTRTNTKVEYVGDYGDSGCAKTTVTIPYPTFSPAYRFTITFTNDVPGTNYPITLSGFNP